MCRIRPKASFLVIFLAIQKKLPGGPGSRLHSTSSRIISLATCSFSGLAATYVDYMIVSFIILFMVFTGLLLSKHYLIRIYSIKNFNVREYR